MVATSSPAGTMVVMITDTNVRLTVTHVPVIVTTGPDRQSAMDEAMKLDAHVCGEEPHMVVRCVLDDTIARVENTPNLCVYTEVAGRMTSGDDLWHWVSGFYAETIIVEDGAVPSLTWINRMPPPDRIIVTSVA